MHEGNITLVKSHESEVHKSYMTAAYNYVSEMHKRI
jgi:hypothetical protein